jgi:hypothetical protein
VTFAKEPGAQAIGHLLACIALRGIHALCARRVHASVPRRRGDGGVADGAPIAKELLLRVQDFAGARS